MPNLTFHRNIKSVFKHRRDVEMSLISQSSSPTVIIPSAVTSSTSKQSASVIQYCPMCKRDTLHWKYTDEPSCSDHSTYPNDVQSKAHLTRKRIAHEIHHPTHHHRVEVFLPSPPIPVSPLTCHGCHQIKPDGMKTDAGWFCKDCLMGIKPKLITPITEMLRSIPPRGATYHVDDGGIVSILCAYCGEQWHLSHCSEGFIGKFERMSREMPLKKYAELIKQGKKLTLIAVDDEQRIAIVQMTIPRIRRAQLCPICYDSYLNLTIMGQVAEGHKPFLNLMDR